MIQYTLKCAEGHTFDSWFQSANAYEKLKKTSMVTCAVCGSSEVEKAIMAPRVNSGEASNPSALTQPRSPAEQAIARLKAHIEANSEYVGKNFAQEARAIHDGAAPERAIWGEARRDEARKLIDDGVPVAPLPFSPTRKSN